MASLDPNEPTPRDPFDDALRARFEHYQDSPAPDAWDDLALRMPQAPAPADPARQLGTRRGLWRAWRPFAGGVAAGVLLLLGVVAPHLTETGRPVANTGEAVSLTDHRVSETGASVSGTDHRVSETGRSVSEADRRVSGTQPSVSATRRSVSGTHRWVAETRQPVWKTHGRASRTPVPVLTGTAAVPPAPAPDSALTRAAPPTAALPPVVQAWLRAAARHPQLMAAEAAALASPTDTAAARHTQALAQAQAAELAALGAALDSLKQALPVVPPALATPLSPDTARETRPLLPPPSRWALLLTAETTPSWSVLPARSAAIPAGKEQIAASLGQQAQVQWQATPRWRLRAGLGQSALQTQLRTVAERSSESFRTDSVLTTEVRTYQTSSVVQITRRDTLLILEPILNGSAQLIGYDTSYVIKADTVRTITTTLVHDTVRRQVVVHRAETFRERQQQLFRPTYRFWTLPVGVTYSLLSRPRWRLDVAAGAQVAVYYRGTRPVLTASGERYELRRVSAREAGFRPVSLSLSGGLEAAYRLSPRLSASVAPSVRWQAVAPGRTGEARALRRVLPALSVGLSYGL